ncbi:2-C-methyl-D-erythritol 4-phosphate cytidylyltransferase [Blastococcus sp. Marseille-P5729]|uniref:IspD/TarI family cytidylyltransferase n=1 Tax=Blastococcus sp. Marseille-P5729 TaxID=2086582 RepID=UPI000D0FA7BA|nr:IspD/TarI family cytidylyltransferase [Blastococcus sp. Marseille-P5729]
MSFSVAVVLAGGRGTRVGADRNKVLLDLAGRPVIGWSIAAFATHPSIDRVVLVGHRDDLDELGRIAETYGVRDVIEGGAERADSERAALDLLRAEITARSVASVVIHDGARPCVSPGLIDRVVRSARVEGVVPTLEAPPLVHIAASRISAAPGHLMRAQTPQGGPAAWLLAAYDDAQSAGYIGTDTASYLERAGYDVRAVPGEEQNLKITYAADLSVAEATLTGLHDKDAGR